MTKEELLKEFLRDPLVGDKGHISPEAVEGLQFIDKTESKFVEALKQAILSKKEDETEESAARRLNKFLSTK